MLLTVVAAAGQSVASDVPAGVAALGGALIGGLAGAAGQYLAEKTRQRGERNHQNRLLLQETYISVIRTMTKAVHAHTDLAGDTAALQRREAPTEHWNELAEYASSTLSPLAEELVAIGASAQAVGTRSVDTGINQMMAWTFEGLRAHTLDRAKRTRLSDEARQKAAEWAGWTVGAIRADLEVKDSRARRKREPTNHPPIIDPLRS